jgi:hypothetical protein
VSPAATNFSRSAARPLHSERLRRSLTAHPKLIPKHIPMMAEHSDEDDPQTVFKTLENGDRLWFVGDALHRDGDLPAVLAADGTAEWYCHGELHRDGLLPACVGADGHQEWWKHGVRHQDYGYPAVTYPNGNKEWWVDGEKQRFEHCAPVQFWMLYDAELARRRRVLWCQFRPLIRP